MNILLLSKDSEPLYGFLRKSLDKRPEDCRIGFVQDAIGRPDHELPDWVLAERAAVAAVVGELEDIYFAELGPDEMREVLDRVDALYLRGGNSFLLREALRVSGADELIVERVRAGLPYVGLSAGAVVAGTSLEPIGPMDDAEAAPDLPSYRGLGLVDVAVVPHADGALPPYPPEMIQDIVTEYGDRYNLLLIEDDQAYVVTPDGARLIG